MQCIDSISKNAVEDERQDRYVSAYIGHFEGAEQELQHFVQFQRANPQYKIHLHIQSTVAISDEIPGYNTCVPDVDNISHGIIEAIRIVAAPFIPSAIAKITVEKWKSPQELNPENQKVSFDNPHETNMTCVIVYLSLFKPTNEEVPEHNQKKLEVKKLGG